MLPLPGPLTWLTGVSATRPNQPSVPDITYVGRGETCYAAFVVDVYSRMIVGWWLLATNLTAELPLEALEMALWRRNTVLDRLIDHSDRGSQLRFNGSIRYTERLTAAGIVTSRGNGRLAQNAVTAPVPIYGRRSESAPWASISRGADTDRHRMCTRIRLFRLCDGQPAD